MKNITYYVAVKIANGTGGESEKQFSSLKEARSDFNLEKKNLKNCADAIVTLSKNEKTIDTFSSTE